MIGRARSLELPVELAICVVNGHIVDAGMPDGHQPVLVELPVFVAVRTEPLAPGGLRLIAVTHGNPRIGESPQLLDQTVVQLAGPFLDQEFDNLVTTLDKCVTITPPTIGDRK